MSALNKKSFLTYLKDGGIYVVLLVLLAIIIFQDPTFLSLLNLSNILTQSSVRIIIALGVAGLIVTQGTDLSAGRQVGLAAVIAATMLQAVDNANKVFPEMATMPIPLVILLVCAIGAVIGLINGIIIAYLNVTPFITTLGTMIIVYGINSLYYDFVGASPISGFDSHFSHFAQGFIALGSFRLSYITFYAAIAVFFVWILWNKTRFGKNIFAIGGNPEAAKVSGVNVALNLLMIYALSGVFYAFGGLLEAGRIGSATNNLGFMYELDAIAACVVGGVSFSGGVGTVLGVVTGVIIWRPWFAPFFPIQVIRYSLLIHATSAIILIHAILIHMYMAFWVKGSIKGMVEGKVSRRWASKHHPRWYREVERLEAKKESLEGITSRRS